MELCEAQFFLGTEDCSDCTAVEAKCGIDEVGAKCGRKIREKGTQLCHNHHVFCFIEVTIMGGDRGGKALNSS